MNPVSRIARFNVMLRELHHTARNLHSLINFFPANRSHSGDIEYKSLTAWLERTEHAISIAEGTQLKNSI